jgi:hypothetical protein
MTTSGVPLKRLSENRLLKAGVPVMDRSRENQIRLACVLVYDKGKRPGEGHGSGFFVARNLILTCAHNLLNASPGDRITIQHGEQILDGTLKYKVPESPRRDPPFSFPDVALIVLSKDADIEPLRLTLEAPKKGDKVYSFGFPVGTETGSWLDSAEAGAQDPVTAGFQTTEFLINIVGGVRQGLSGAPLLKGGSVAVVGMIRDTTNPHRDWGGHATPTEFIVKGIPSLASLDIQGTAHSPSGDILDTHDSNTFLTEISLAGPLEQISASERDDPIAIVNPRVRRLIDDSRSLRRKARPREAIKVAKLAVGDPEFASLGKVDRASAIRELAVGYFEVGELDEAERLAKKSRALDPLAFRQIGFDAELTNMRKGPVAALEELAKHSAPELEAYRAGFFLQSKQFRDALTTLESLPDSERDQPRVQRLLALAYLGLHDRENMVRTADEAFSGSHDDLQVAYVVACCYVLLPLSRDFWPANLGGWPQPAPIDRNVPEAARNQRLKRAFELFTNILEGGESDEEGTAALLTWRFVSLALDNDRRFEANEEATRLLAANPPNYRIIPWVWELKLDTDLAPALQVLEDRRSSGLIGVEEILVLSMGRIQQDLAGEAELLLLNSRAVFEAAAEIPTWSFALVQTLVAQGKLPDARRLLPDLAPAQRHIADLILLENETGDEASTIKRLTSEYETTGDTSTLHVAVELANRRKDWKYLAEYGPKLFAAEGSIAAARYSSYGAYNVGNDAATIESIADFEAVSNDMPADLLYLRARALHRQGSSEAMAAYERLIQAYLTSAHLRSFANYAASIGDVAKVVVLAQMVLQLPSDPEIDLEFARACRPDNRDLSLRLWMRALETEPLPDYLVPTAFTLGVGLDAGPKLATLSAAMQRLGAAGEHGLRLVSASDLPAQLLEAQKRTGNIYALYQSSEVPVHLFCAETNATLIDTHVEAPLRNLRAEVNGGFEPLYVRHGSLPLSELNIEGKSVFLDITSLLLAIGLDVLDELRSSFTRVFISPGTSGLLLSYRDRLDSTPEARLKALQDIASFVSQGRLKTTSQDVASEAAANNAILCDWQPRDDFDATSPKRLVEALRQSGKLSQADCARADRVLGNALLDFGPKPSPGQTLVFTFNTVEVLQEAGVIEKILATHPIYIEDAFLTYVRNELDKSARHERTAAWVRAAIETVRSGVTDGWLRHTPGNANGQTSGRAEADVLTSVFSNFAEPSMAVIVVDDRYVNAYPHRDDGTPIVSLWDVLRAMKDSNSLPIERYRAVLTEMRARCLLYIPPTVDELLFHIKSSFQGETFVPTRELLVLERYLAFALLDRPGFNGPSAFGLGHRSRQTMFLVQCGSALRETIRLLLDEDSAHSNVAAWIRDHLALEAIPGYGADGYTASQPEAAVDVEGANYLVSWAMSQ